MEREELELCDVCADELGGFGFDKLWLCGPCLSSEIARLKADRAAKVGLEGEPALSCYKVKLPTTNVSRSRVKLNRPECSYRLDVVGGVVYACATSWEQVAGLFPEAESIRHLGPGKIAASCGSAQPYCYMVTDHVAEESEESALTYVLATDMSGVAGNVAAAVRIGYGVVPDW